MTHFKKISEALQFSPEKMKKNGLFETDRFFCDTYCFEPGQEQSAHTHEGQDKVYYVLEGKGVFSVGNEERELGAGEIALAPAGQKHGVANHSQARLVTLVFVTPKPHH
ncbi:MAG TPA: cupin domain-containing protein [Terriglobales bacterium]|jgi:quercetin dioxygenase-like cupin family protein|nr:cupin domain-containing protein [Terriglobales bacterium]